MKKSLLKFTTPALVVGLALSAGGGVSAADNKVEVKENKAEFNQSFKKGSDVSHRLAPVEKKVSAVNKDLVEIGTELEGEETLTFEELVEYQEQIDNAYGKLGAASNQLNAVTKKFDENSLEVIDVEVAITSAMNATQLTQEYLSALEVIEEFPEIEEPEPEPEPEVPEEPITP